MIIHSSMIIFSLLSSLAAGQAFYPKSIVNLLNDSDKDGVINARDTCPNTNSGYEVDNNGCSITNIKRFNFDFDIMFEHGKYHFALKFLPKLSKLANFLKDYSETSVVIEGYTDNIGAENFNLKLSKQRAQAIAGALTQSFFISKRRLKVFGYGEDKPRDTNATALGRANNRRVTALIVSPLSCSNASSYLCESDEYLLSKNTLEIHFQKDSHHVSSMFNKPLQELSLLVKKQPDSIVLIEGHTDNLGEATYNLTLSENRANAVANTLLNHFNLPQHKIKSLGYGSSQPTDTNETLTGRENNRRVSVQVMPIFKDYQEHPKLKWTIWDKKMPKSTLYLNTNLQ